PKNAGAGEAQCGQRRGHKERPRAAARAHPRRSGSSGRNMMSTTFTGSRTHDQTCNVSEGQRQLAVAAAGNNQASVVAAEIAHYRNVVASSRGNNNSADVSVALHALRSLGVHS